MNSDRLQRVVTASFALTLFNSWVLFEETVIDRFGWWRILPCYRRGLFCEWDVAAIVVILVIVALLVGRTASRSHL